ncbi:hypothetical protein DL93DRAFT_2079853 [Clavulina sp. PMI_390]|nr:hypothetical protein DL93DRAFT_2079853 [Clavulina sp. PMI_390]
MATGVLVHGVGLEDSAASCSLAIFSCILLYTTTKLLIYIFLSERVWLVWSNMAASKAGLASLQSPNTPRRTSMHVQSPTTTSPGVEKTQFTPEWQSGIMKRLKNPVYLVCLVSLIGYLVIIILLCINRINGFRKQDGTCVIGLARQGSIPLITYDA